MNSPYCMWLADIEDMLRLMIRGVFLFTFRRLPEWVYRTLLETVGPITIRLFRVFVFFLLWLAVVFGPAVAVAKLHLPLWGLLAAAWLALAIIGSTWGRLYLAKKRCAADQMAGADHPDLDALSSRCEYSARS